MDWNRLPATRGGIRQLGAVLIIAAYSAIHHLFKAGHNYAVNAPPLAYLLALVAFLGFSFGCALMIHGHHLFTEFVSPKDGGGYRDRQISHFRCR